MASSNKYLYVNIPPGGTVKVSLEWNDPWIGSSNDYKISDYGTQYFSYIAASVNSQTGTQNPYGRVLYTNTGSTAIDAFIVVENYNGLAATRTLEVYIYGEAYPYPYNIVAVDSIFGHPAVPDVIAVAAVPVISPSTIEYFSSRGPVTISYPSAESRAKRKSPVLIE